MKFLSWSTLSIISRMLTLSISIIQTILIAELLTSSELALRAIAFKIAASFGIFLSLGLSSILTREASISETHKEKSGLLITGLLLRYAITLPVIFILIFRASNLANGYNAPELTIPIQILGITLFIEAGQIVFDAIIKGFKKFKFLLIFQILVALLSLILLVYFLSSSGFIGVFYAHFALNFIWTIVMLLYVMKLMNWRIDFPSFSMIKNYTKALMMVGVFLYVVKICTNWLNLPEILLGREITATALGAFTFAYMIASKINQVSDALTDISLPSMSKEYAENQVRFIDTFKNGNGKAIYLISIVTLLVIIFKFYGIVVIDYIVGLFVQDRLRFTEKFSDAFSIVNYLSVAFWGYSILNLFQAGLNLPAKKLIQVTTAYVLLISTTFILYYILPINEPILRMNLAFISGAMVGLLTNIILTSKSLGWLILHKRTIVFMMFFLALSVINISYNNIYVGIASLLLLLLPIKKFI